ncbi:hypothetical protein, partial [Aeromonas enteropelogenes]|uniref:hypothetical protein n=1 Tax=Aeromonas enteropelogenes TaxID=29489 RepID=UPI003BA2B2A4
MVEVLTGAERRRRRTPQEKITIVQQTFEPGMTVSHVYRSSYHLTPASNRCLVYATLERASF